MSNASSLSNVTQSSGHAGKINIDAADSVLINTNSNIFTNTFAQGNAGNIFIKAGNNFILEGTNVEEFQGISSSASLDESVSNNLEGLAGNISIEANNIFLRNGASIGSDTFGSGNAGDVSLNANLINLENNSRVSSAVGSLEINTRATGNGGKIDIETQTLSLSDGGIIFTQTFGTGNAGVIKINASESIDISGVAAFPLLFTENSDLSGGFSSGLFSNSEESASGAGGEVIVTTPTLIMTDGAVINARSRSNGNAGNITVDASILAISNGSQILATAFSTGNAGNINLDISERVSISGIDADYQNRLETVRNTFGESEAQFTIDPVSEVSGIFANTSLDSTGKGGNIALGVFSVLEDTSTLDPTQSTSEIVLSDRGTIAVDSQGSGNSGTISLNAAELTLDNQAAIVAQTNVLLENQINNQIDINLKIDDSLKLRESSLISAQALQANGGNINIDAVDGFVVAFPSQNQGSDIVANAAQTGGNITISSQAVLGLQEGMAFSGSGVRLDNESNDLDVTGSINGVIEIITPDVDAIQGMPELSANPLESAQSINRVCDLENDTNGTSLVVKGKGGVPIQPTEPLSSHEISIGNEAANLNTSNVDKLANNRIPSNSITTSIGEIIPARGVKFAANGDVVLVGYRTDVNQRDLVVPTNCN